MCEVLLYRTSRLSSLDNNYRQIVLCRWKQLGES